MATKVGNAQRYLSIAPRTRCSKATSLAKADAELNHDSSTNGLIKWFKKHQA